MSQLRAAGSMPAARAPPSTGLDFLHWKRHLASVTADIGTMANEGGEVTRGRRR